MKTKLTGFNLPRYVNSDFLAFFQIKDTSILTISVVTQLVSTFHELSDLKEQRKVTVHPDLVPILKCKSYRYVEFGNIATNHIILPGRPTLPSRIDMEYVVKDYIEFCQKLREQPTKEEKIKLWNAKGLRPFAPWGLFDRTNFMLFPISSRDAVRTFLLIWKRLRGRGYRDTGMLIVEFILTR